MGESRSLEWGGETPQTYPPSLWAMSSKGNIAERVKVATSNGGDPPPSLWAMLTEGNIAEWMKVAAIWSQPGNWSQSVNLSVWQLVTTELVTAWILVITYLVTAW